MHAELEESKQALTNLRKHLSEGEIPMDIFIISYLDLLEAEIDRLDTYLKNNAERSKKHLENGLILSKACSDYEKAMEVIHDIFFNKNRCMYGMLDGNHIDFEIKSGVPRRITLKPEDALKLRKALYGDQE